MSFVAISGIATAKPTSSFTPIDSAPLPTSVPAPVTAATASQPTFISNVWSGIKAVGSDVVGAVKDAFTNAPAQDAFSAPANAPNDTVKNLITSLSDAGNQMKSGVSDIIANHQAFSGTPAGALGVAKVGLGAISAAFAPVSAVINYAQHVPGLGTLATGLNALFGAIGSGGSDAAEGAVQALPISQSAKDEILPVAKQAGALAAQLIVGKAGGDTLSTLTDHTKTIIDRVNSELQVAQTAVEGGAGQLPKGFTPIGESVSENVSITKLEKTITPVNESPGPQNVQFSNKYTLPDELPTIKAGATPKEALPVIQTDVPSKAPAGYSYAPTKESVPSPLQPTGAPDSLKPTEAAASTVPESAVPPKFALEAAKPLQTEPGQSRIGKSIEVKAVEAKLTQGFDGTAGYDPITIKDQAERATKLINDSPAQARAAIRGEAPLPEGLKGTALITAMEEHIKANPSGDLAYELANSPLVSATSHAAQEMRLAAERVPDSITAKYQEIKAARQAALEKRGGMKKAVKQLTDEIQKEIKKTVSKRPDWESFVKDLQCNY